MLRHRTLHAALAAAASLLLFAAPAPAEKKPSLIDVAVAKAFPGAKVERITVRLDDEQRARVGKLASQRAPKKSTTFAYVARNKKGEVVGTAFFDSHIVRTKRETLMVVVTPDGKVRDVETIVFQEPPEYVAQDSFYESLEGRGQGRALILGRGLDGTTGVTLTCRAVADAARRVLAVHEVAGSKVGRVEPEPRKKTEKKAEKKAPQKAGQSAPAPAAGR